MPSHRSRPPFSPPAPQGSVAGALLLLALVSAPVSGPTAAGGESPPPQTALEHAQKHLNPKYVCPMHPEIVRDEPGNCPICGMNLVERPMEADPGERPAVSISGEVMQSMGVRTARVERGALWQTIHTVGSVDYDETRLEHIHPRAEGWIERLEVRAEGEAVKKGQVLAHLYAPQILAAQVDFLLALGPQESTGRVKVDKARNLLRLLAVPEEVIRELERSRQTSNTVPVLAPAAGVVTRLEAREGMFVEPNTTLFSIADLDRVWVLVDVFEHQLGWLKPGLKAQIRVPAYPGRTWEGKLDYLYPELNPKTRTLRVRLVFPNPEGLLRPNMFADVTILGEAKRDALKIPREALIPTGERETVVKALGGGRFQPVDVVSGMQRGEAAEILSGLTEGDEVVVSGQFLIDSESSLRASYLRMSPAGPAAEPATAPSSTPAPAADPHAQHHH